MNSYAPIVLFVYNRPWHTQRTITSLMANNLAFDSDLYVFSDAPKNENSIAKVNEVREYIKSVKGFKKVTIIERKENYGLVKSIKEGVTEIVNKYGTVIVLEDDLVTHPQFLEFINYSLQKYETCDDVYSISGYSYLSKLKEKEVNESEFIKLTCTWTWATWAKKWKVFNQSIDEIVLFHNNKRLKKEFNYNNSYNFYKMLLDSQNGSVKSWGIYWYWSVFKKNGLTLYPTYTLVDHIGLDGSGENSKDYIVNFERIKNINYKFSYPKEILESSFTRKRLTDILKKRKLVILKSILIKKLKSIFGK